MNTQDNPTMPNADAAIATAGQLSRLLAAAGFVPGLPAGLPAEAARIDRASVRRLRCPGCRRRGMHYQPWHRGARYRVLARCPHCRCAEER